MQSKSGLPTKNESQMHLLVFISQVAPIPQMTPSQRCLHLPPMQTFGDLQGIKAEHTSVSQEPPGNGFPENPFKHLQVGPSLVTMQVASSAHINLSHTEK